MAFSETCSRCGEEVRRGWRHEREGYWHREDVDHEPVFGHIMTPEDWAEIERQRHLVRYDDDGNPYTTAEYEARKIKNKAARAEALAELAGDDEEEVPLLEPVEVHTINLPHKGRVFVGCPDGTVAVAAVPGGARTMLNLAKKQGWTVERLTYARGPYLGANGSSLGVSDSVVLLLRGPIVDESPILGIASWRDGKSDWAYRVENGNATRVGAKALIARMKEAPCGPDPEAEDHP